LPKGAGTSHGGAEAVPGAQMASCGLRPTRTLVVWPGDAALWHDQIWSSCKCGGEVYVESSVGDMYVFPMQHPPLITLKIYTDNIDNYTHSCPSQSVLNTVYVYKYCVGIQKQSQSVNLPLNKLVFPAQFCL